MQLVSVGVAGSVLIGAGSWGADQISSNGPDWQGLAALVTSVGGIIAISLSTWLQVRGKHATSEETKDEIIQELLEQLVETKKAEAVKKVRRAPKEKP